MSRHNQLQRGIGSANGFSIGKFIDIGLSIGYPIKGVKSLFRRTAIIQWGQCQVYSPYCRSAYHQGLLLTVSKVKKPLS